MTVTKHVEGGKIILELEGRLDTTTAHDLQDAIDEAIPSLKLMKGLTLDFAKLTYVSSAGLRVLLMGEKKTKAASSVMTLRGVSPEVMEVFTMTGFSEMLTIV